MQPSCATHLVLRKKHDNLSFLVYRPLSNCKHVATFISLTFNPETCIYRVVSAKQTTTKFCMNKSPH
ncbi:hypothetical protein EUGRSUZ_C00093 [Eucalyptus grandis]|uniref:Uncharacterized protein n=2 Tax=Eucalyptus grandis TaxID=71139 RepID=A0ACC3L8N8_EUCGR|nr:hypothetical protein EUGRSUZ_C00093 [Eucalyptus grandis]